MGKEVRRRFNGTGREKAVPVQLYANLGIRCNAIAPGGVETDISTPGAYINPFGAERAMAGMNLNPRTGKPEEIGQHCLISCFRGFQFHQWDSDFITAPPLHSLDSGNNLYP